MSRIVNRTLEDGCLFYYIFPLYCFIGWPLGMINEYQVGLQQGTLHRLRLQDGKCPCGGSSVPN